MALDLASLRLGLEPSALRTPCAFRRASRRGRRGECLPEKGGEPFAGGVAVVSLRPVFGGVDGQDRAHEARRESPESVLPLPVGQ